MGRKRYLSTDISVDARVRQMAQQSEFDALLYTWMIPHTSDDATITADPEELLMQVVPGFRWRTAADVAAAVERMLDLGLVERHNGRLRFPPEAFYKYQPYVTADRREAAAHVTKKVARNSAQNRAKPRNSRKRAEISDFPGNAPHARVVSSSSSSSLSDPGSSSASSSDSEPGVAREPARGSDPEHDGANGVAADLAEYDEGVAYRVEAIGKLLGDDNVASSITRVRQLQARLGLSNGALDNAMKEALHRTQKRMADTKQPLVEAPMAYWHKTLEQPAQERAPPGESSATNASTSAD